MSATKTNKDMDNKELAKKILEIPNDGVCENIPGRIKEDGTMEFYRVFSGNNKQKKIEELLSKHSFLSNVSNRRELLLDFAEYSENDKTSTAIDECVDNYLDSIK